MAFTPGSSVTIANFNGAWVPSASALDQVKIPLTNGRLARNCQYFGSDVATRYGHSLVFSPGDSVTAMVNWLFLNGTTPANYLAWFAAGVGLRVTSLASPAVASPIIAQTSAATASICPLGSRLYVAFMDANGIGAAAGQIYSQGVGADPLFAPPLASPVLSVSELVFSGSCTSGVKAFGFLIQTRNGYITKPSPCPGDIFSPVSGTFSGGKVLQMNITPATTWPSYAKSVIPLMTTSANNNLFFIIPHTQGQYNVTPGTSTTVPIAIDLTDDSLNVNGTDATAYINQLSQSVTGTSPLNPSVIVPYGQRLGYITIDAAGVPVIYFSDPSQYQSINAAKSGVYLPGELQITTGFSLRGVFYACGPHWTFSTSDNNDVPTTWAQPQLVDGSIGAIGPFCVSLNAAQNYAWVADEAGLYLFEGGSYPARPISYWQTADWKRINFAATTKIMVIDDKANQRVMVLAPLDGATSPTHQLVWDYSLGNTPEQAQYALNDISSYSPGAFAMVQNNGTKHLETWYGPSNGVTGIIRANDGSETHPYRDIAAAINSQYEYAPVPRGFQGRLMFHNAAQLRIRGNGSAQFTAYSLDRGASAGPFSIGLDVDPDQEILQRFFLESEYASGLISTNVVDQWFNLARVDHYFSPGCPMR